MSRVVDANDHHAVPVVLIPKGKQLIDNNTQTHLENEKNLLKQLCSSDASSRRSSSRSC